MGLNDIAASDTNIIIEEIINVNNILSEGHTIVTCTILFPPKLTHNVNKFYQSNIEKIRKVNKVISELNVINGGIHLHLHLFGVNGNPMVSDFKHNFNDWREPTVKKKLHLSKNILKQIGIELALTFKKMKIKC